MKSENQVNHQSNLTICYSQSVYAERHCSSKHDHPKIPKCIAGKNTHILLSESKEQYANNQRTMTTGGMERDYILDHGFSFNSLFNFTEKMVISTILFPPPWSPRTHSPGRQKNSLQEMLVCWCKRRQFWFLKVRMFEQYLVLCNSLQDNIVPVILIFCLMRYDMSMVQRRNAENESTHHSRGWWRQSISVVAAIKRE